jgi:hypothetical protein
LVPAALTLMIGTRGKMKTSALLRDVVQRYDQDPKLTSSSAYGPKTLGYVMPLGGHHHQGRNQPVRIFVHLPITYSCTTR